MPPPKEDGIRHPPKVAAGTFGAGGTPPGTPPGTAARGGRDQRAVRVDRTGFDTVLGSDGAAAADVFRGFEGHDLAELYVLPRRCLDPEKLKGRPKQKAGGKKPGGAAAGARDIAPKIKPPVCPPAPLPAPPPKPRDDVDMRGRLTRHLMLNVPLVSGSEDTVTGSALAIAVALEGGIGVLSGAGTIEEQVSELCAVKDYTTGFVTEPPCCKPDAVLASIYPEWVRGTYLCVTEDGTRASGLLGVVTSTDVGIDGPAPGVQASDVMTPASKLQVAQDPVSLSEARELLAESRKSLLPIVDGRATSTDAPLVAVVRRRDTLKARDHPAALRGSGGELRCAAAVQVPRPGCALPNTEPPGSEDPPPESLHPDLHGSFMRAARLLDYGVDALVIEAVGGASAYQVELVKAVKATFPRADVIAGDVLTRRQAKALLAAGADGLRVAGCDGNDRPVTRPLASAVYHVARAAAEADPPVPVLVDAGSDPRDAAMALACGASALVLSKYLAGTTEASGPDLVYAGSAKVAKFYCETGSLAAQFQGSEPMFGCSKPPRISKDMAIARHPLARVKRTPRLNMGGAEVVDHAGPAGPLLRNFLGDLRRHLVDLGVVSIEDLHSLTNEGILRFEICSRVASREEERELRETLSGPRFLPYADPLLPFYEDFGFPRHKDWERFPDYLRHPPAAVFQHLRETRPALLTMGMGDDE